MATNVNVALAEFMKDHVNLDPDQTKLARKSRDWLLDQVRQFPASDATFPKAYDEVDMPLGSFHRRTKLRPLDDIDLIVGLSAESSTYETANSRIELNVHPDSSRLLALCHDGTTKLNSKRILNKYVSALEGVPQYGRAEIGRNGEAAVVSLSTYEWSFDIVPAFFTKPESDGRTFYLIPDGNGHWKKTDPRIDEARVRTVNQQHSGFVLPSIRLAKYWNRRRTVPTVNSYALESMVVTHYEAPGATSSQYVDLELRSVLATLSSAIFFAVPDPKRIQGDLNTLTMQERHEFSIKAKADIALLDAARASEEQGDHRAAMARLREILGPDFPAFG